MMNTQLLKSKKFRAALGAALTAVFTYAALKFGMEETEISEIITLCGVVMSPFLIYIGAEGYSERDAKTEAVRLSDIEKQRELARLQTTSNNPQNLNG